MLPLLPARIGNACAQTYLECFTRTLVDSTQCASTWVPGFVVINMETNNPSHMFKQFATSNYSCAVKFRQFAEDMTLILSVHHYHSNENIVDWKQQN
jgi:hypothetical protein